MTTPADHIRRERQAAQERVAQVQANLREEQARLQVTEDLVTRLKRELNEVQRNKERRLLVAVAMNWKRGPFLSLLALVSFSATATAQEPKTCGSPTDIGDGWSFVDDLDRGSRAAGGSNAARTPARQNNSSDRRTK